jgi:hypothetical protein
MKGKLTGRVGGREGRLHEGIMKGKLTGRVGGREGRAGYSSRFLERAACIPRSVLTIRQQAADVARDTVDRVP